jgi:hypothetical protein
MSLFSFADMSATKFLHATFAIAGRPLNDQLAKHKQGRRTDPFAKRWLNSIVKMLA